jgi:hypothetical protein
VYGLKPIPLSVFSPIFLADTFNLSACCVLDQQNRI